MSVVQALLIALFVAAVESRALGYATLTMRFSPLMAGFVVGLVLGNMPLAMTTVATIQLIYMGVVAPGGAMPSEPCIASAMAVSTVIVGNLKPEAAVAIAVPVGLLGSYLYQLRFFMNTFAVTKMDACAVKADSKGLAMWIGVMPTIFSFVLFVPLMFVAPRARHRRWRPCRSWYRHYHARHRQPQAAAVLLPGLLHAGVRQHAQHAAHRCQG